MYAFVPEGRFSVYCATCGLLVAVTCPFGNTLIVAEAVFVGSRWLVATTVIEVGCVTVGAVKVPLASMFVLAIPAPPGMDVTDQSTSASPAESVAVSCTVSDEKTVALVGVTERMTGGEEAQPASKIKKPHKQKNTPAIRVIK